MYMQGSTQEYLNGDLNCCGVLYYNIFKVNRRVVVSSKRYWPIEPLTTSVGKTLYMYRTDLQQVKAFPSQY